MAEAQTPTFKLDPLKTTEGEFTCDISYWEPSKAEFEEFNTAAAQGIFDVIKAKAKDEIPGLLAYPNFYGEAEAHMVSRGIPFNKQIRDAYAQAIRKDFLDGLEEAITFDPDTGLISISPYIFALEFGDFYRPAVQFVSNCIKQWIADLEKAQGSAK